MAGHINTNNPVSIFDRMRKILHVIFAVSLALPAGADTIRLHGKPSFRNVRVLNFRAGHVVFRGVSGQILRKPLHEVDWLELDEASAFNAAERAAARDARSVAVESYATALAQTDERWMRELILMRQLAVADQPPTFDRAVATWIRLLTEYGGNRAAHRPHCPANPGSKVNARALAALETAVDLAGDSAAWESMRISLIELLIYEEVTALPPWVGPSERGVTSQPVTTATTTQPAPKAPLGLLPPPGSQSPPSKPEPEPRRTSTEPLRLPVDSYVLDAVAAALSSGQLERATRLMELAQPFIPPADTDRWRLLAARVDLAQGNPAQAAADLLALADAAGTEPALAAEALYYVGRAHEALNRPDVAHKMYVEVVEHAGSTARLREQSQNRLKKLDAQPRP